jgi:DNA-binding response OmpR family regulator
MSQQAAPAPTVNCAELTVLVVDDHERLRNDVVQQLRVLGFSRIDTASTSAAAEEKMAAHQYDIIFLDWVMPGRSGLALMQACREQRAFDHIAFVMVTSQTDERRMVEALKAGATAYIIKPLIPESFRSSVQAVISWVARSNPRFRNGAT